MDKKVDKVDTRAMSLESKLDDIAEGTVTVTVNMKRASAASASVSNSVPKMVKQLTCN